MTAKQRKFVEEYVIDLNITRAYKAAYPHVKNDGTACACGSRLLKDANVEEYVKKLLEEISSSKIATATEVMEYLTSVMRGEQKDQKLNADGDVFQLRVESKDRLKAAAMLGKRYGLDKSQDSNAEMIEKLDEVLSKIGGVI